MNSYVHALPFAYVPFTNLLAKIKFVTFQQYGAGMMAPLAPPRHTLNFHQKIGF